MTKATLCDDLKQMKIDELFSCSYIFYPNQDWCDNKTNKQKKQSIKNKTSCFTRSVHHSTDKDKISGNGNEMLYVNWCTKKQHILRIYVQAKPFLYDPVSNVQVISPSSAEAFYVSYDMQQIH